MELAKECKACGKIFEPTCHITRQKYCSDACRIKYNNAKRYFGGKVDTCVECGVHVEQSEERGRSRRYCSDRCRVMYNEKKRQERERTKERPKQLCPNCGVEFQPEWNGGKQRRFCSDSCRIQWWKEYHKVNPKEVPVEQKCVHCGQEYNGSRWNGGEYCSRNCYLAAMAKTHVETICAWCGNEFSSVASRDRKYCCRDCAVAARHDSGGPVKARRRISYCNSEEWRNHLREATIKAGNPSKRGKRVWLVCGVTSMYTGLDGLLGIVRYRLNHNPYDGSIYVFCDVGCTMLKSLEWDGAGFCISKRRAQSGSYPWPPFEAGQMLEISEKEFEFLRSKSIVPTRAKKAL